MWCSLLWGLLPGVGHTGSLWELSSCFDFGYLGAVYWGVKILALDILDSELASAARA